MQYHPAAAYGRSCPSAREIRGPLHPSLRTSPERTMQPTSRPTPTRGLSTLLSLVPALLLTASAALAQTSYTVTRFDDTLANGPNNGDGLGTGVSGDLRYGWGSLSGRARFIESFCKLNSESEQNCSLICFAKVLLLYELNFMAYSRPHSWRFPPSPGACLG